MAYDPLPRWEWEGGAPARLDCPEVEACETPTGQKVVGPDPAGSEAARGSDPEMRSRRGSDRALAS
jgi:hypothetical protein